MLYLVIETGDVRGRAEKRDASRSRGTLNLASVDCPGQASMCEAFVSDIRFGQPTP